MYYVRKTATQAEKFIEEIEAREAARKQPRHIDTQSGRIALHETDEITGRELFIDQIDHTPTDDFRTTDADGLPIEREKSSFFKFCEANCQEHRELVANLKVAQAFNCG